MNIEQRNQGSMSSSRFRIGLHLGMGTLYLIFGILVIYVKYFGTMQLSKGVAYTLGILLLIYGSFRIIRGILDIKQMRRER